MQTQSVYYRIPIQELEHVVGAFVAETCPAVGINVIHKQGNIILCQEVKGCSFREDIRMNSWFFYADPFCHGAEGSQ